MLKKESKKTIQHQKVKRDLTEKRAVIKKQVVSATKIKDEFTRALGRRKEAVARVRLIPNGQGEILINNKKLDEYFPYFELKNKVTGPLDIVGKRTSFDFSVKVNGGGKSGQAAAVGLGIARALIEFNEEYRPSLRSHGYLTRDPRAKERKKFGLKRARRAPQWSKR